MLSGEANSLADLYRSFSYASLLEVIQTKNTPLLQPVSPFLPFLFHLCGPSRCCSSVRADMVSDKNNSDKVYLEPTILGFLLLGCRGTD